MMQVILYAMGMIVSFVIIGLIMKLLYFIGSHSFIIKKISGFVQGLFK